MRVLVSNDDGVDAPGIRILAAGLRDAGHEVLVVAPDRDGKGTDDEEVKKQAVFALSQRRNGEAIPALIEVARNNRYPEVRRSALFWLGQSGDPRAISLFEEILRK